MFIYKWEFRRNVNYIVLQGSDSFCDYTIMLYAIHDLSLFQVSSVWYVCASIFYLACLVFGASKFSILVLSLNVAFVIVSVILYPQMPIIIAIYFVDAVFVTRGKINEQQQHQYMFIRSHDTFLKNDWVKNIFDHLSLHFVELVPIRLLVAPAMCTYSKHEPWVQFRFNQHGRHNLDISWKTGCNFAL